MRISTRNRLIVVACVVAGCQGEFPRDQQGASKRVATTHVLRVGLTENAPWVVRGREPSGAEVKLAQRLAESQGARVQWEWGQLETLFARLSANQLELVVGGIDRETPWDEQVGLTNPWCASAGRERVLAVPSGENQWLGIVEEVAHRSASLCPDGTSP